MEGEDMAESSSTSTAAVAKGASVREAIDLLNRVRHIYEPIVNPLELIFRRNKDHS